MGSLLFFGFIVGGIAEGIEMIVGETLAVEGIMCVLCRNTWSTLYHQYHLQILFSEGIGKITGTVPLIIFQQKLW